MTEFHVATALFERIGKYGDRTAIRYRQNDVWQEISWNGLGEQVRAAAKGLLAMGIKEGEMVGIFSQNCPEWTIADYAILSLRGVSVPIYATNTPKQAEYIVDEAEIGIVFVGAQEQYDHIRAMHGGVPQTQKDHRLRRGRKPCRAANAVYFKDFLEEGRRAGGDAEIDERLKRASMDDLATLIYTSGTTGEPKGVMLHHSNFYHSFIAHKKRLDVSDRDISMCFLPLSHVFERAWTYFALSQGMVVNYCDDTAKIVEYLQQVKPTIMCAVPRFYEKIYAAVFEKLERRRPSKKKLFLWAVGVGGQVFLLREGTSCRSPRILNIKHKIAEALVLKKLQGVVGGRIRFFPCAGAPLSKKIEEFFHAAGHTDRLRLRPHGDDCATVTCHEEYHFRPGTVGKADPRRRGEDRAEAARSGQGGNGHEGLLQKAGGDGGGVTRTAGSGRGTWASSRTAT